MNIIDAIINTNVVLILLGVGTIIWVVRQVLPDPVENSKYWKIVLNILPIVLGVSLAMIPQLRPMTSLTQSAVIGGVAGSFSSSVYGIAREIFGERVRLLLGSKASKVKANEESSENTME